MLEGLKIARALHREGAWNNPKVGEASGSLLEKVISCSSWKLYHLDPRGSQVKLQNPTALSAGYSSAKFLWTTTKLMLEGLKIARALHREGAWNNPKVSILETTTDKHS
ncbi:MAG: hypothetical protein ACJAQ5_001287 [Flavobacteriales bacterium]|jgi:hypothetical protein